MSRAKRKDAWDRTASVLAMLINVQPGKKRKLFKPAEFHPMLKASQPMTMTARDYFKMLKPTQQ